MRNPGEDIKWIDEWQHTERATNPGFELEQ